MDVDGMKSLWDQEFDGLIYQSEESAEPFTSWQAIADYWDAAPTVVEAVDEWRSLDRWTTMVGDVATIFTRLTIAIRLVNVPKPLTGEIRCSLVMRQTPSGKWLEVKSIPVATGGGLPNFYTVESIADPEPERPSA